MSTRFGYRIGRGFVSLGRSGLRAGGRLGRVRVSTGRSGTRLSAGQGRAFVTTWVPARRPPGRHAAPRPAARRGSGGGLILAVLVLGLIIWGLAHL